MTICIKKNICTTFYYLLLYKINTKLNLIKKQNSSSLDLPILALIRFIIWNNNNKRYW